MLDRHKLNLLKSLLTMGNTALGLYKKLKDCLSDGLILYVSIDLQSIYLTFLLHTYLQGEFSLETC